MTMTTITFVDVDATKLEALSLFVESDHLPVVGDTITLNVRPNYPSEEGWPKIVSSAGEYKVKSRRMLVTKKYLHEVPNVSWFITVEKVSAVAATSASPSKKAPAAWAEPCPYCHAARGASCVYPDGNTRPSHVARVDAHFEKMGRNAGLALAERT
jgi:hypothetical protein